MHNAYVVTGTLTDERTVALDETLPLAQTRVRLVVEPANATAGDQASAADQPRSHAEVLEEIWRRQQERGYQPPRREDVDAALQAERDSWD